MILPAAVLVDQRPGVGFGAVSGAGDDGPGFGPGDGVSTGFGADPGLVDVPVSGAECGDIVSLEGSMLLSSRRSDM